MSKMISGYYKAMRALEMAKQCKLEIEVFDTAISYLRKHKDIDPGEAFEAALWEWDAFPDDYSRDLQSCLDSIQDLHKEQKRLDDFDKKHRPKNLIDLM